MILEDYVSLGLYKFTQVSSDYRTLTFAPRDSDQAGTYQIVLVLKDKSTLGP